MALDLLFIFSNERYAVNVVKKSIYKLYSIVSEELFTNDILSLFCSLRNNGVYIV